MGNKLADYIMDMFQLSYMPILLLRNPRETTLNVSFPKMAYLGLTFCFNYSSLFLQKKKRKKNNLHHTKSQDGSTNKKAE